MQYRNFNVGTINAFQKSIVPVGFRVKSGQKEMETQVLRKKSNTFLISASFCILAFKHDK